MKEISLTRRRYPKTIKSAMRKSGLINKPYADFKMKEIGDSLFGDGHWKFVDTDDSFIRVNSKTSYMAYIGTGYLTYHCENLDTYNKAAYVWTIGSMYHEYRHYQQFMGWDVENKAVFPGQDNVLKLGINNLREQPFRKAVARRNLVLSFVPSAYTWNYGQDPREFDAEEYRIRNTIKCFNSMEQNAISGSTAGRMLYDIMTAEDYVHHKRLSEANVHDILDIAAFFRKEKASIFKEKYVITMEPSADPRLRGIELGSPGITEKLLEDPAYESHRKMLETCRTGIEMDKVINQVIILEHQDVLDTQSQIRMELHVTKQQMEVAKVLNPAHTYCAVHPDKIKSWSITEGREYPDVSQMSISELMDFELALIDLGSDILDGDCLLSEDIEGVDILGLSISDLMDFQLAVSDLKDKDGFQL